MFYKEIRQTREAKQAQHQSSQLDEEFSSTILWTASIFLCSRTRKSFIKYCNKRQYRTELKRAQTLFITTKSCIQQQDGETWCLANCPQKSVCTELCLHTYELHALTPVYRISGEHKHFCCHPFANSFLLWFTCHYRVSSAMSTFLFQEPLTAGLRLYSHNHVSNCQQEAILKSHLSKILCTYCSEDNTLPESRETSLARTFKIDWFWWGPPIPKGMASCHQVKDWFLFLNLNLNS